MRNITCGTASQIQTIIELNALLALRSMLDNPDIDILREACRAIANIAAETEELVQSLMNASLFPKIVVLLESNDSITQDIAARAAINVACLGSEEQILNLVQHGVVPPLCALLCVLDAGMVDEVLEVLEGLDNLLTKAHVRVSQIMHGCGGRRAVELLLKHRNTNVRKQAKALLEIHFGALTVADTDTLFMTPTKQGGSDVEEEVKEAEEEEEDNKGLLQEARRVKFKQVMPYYMYLLLHAKINYTVIDHCVDFHHSYCPAAHCAQSKAPCRP